jgi:hypothetical protein
MRANSMPYGPPKPSWKEDLLEWGLKLLFAPIWIPAMVFEHYQLWAKTRPLVQCPVEEAWERCSTVWKKRGLVCQYAAHDGAAFEHELAAILARKHPGQGRFFLEKLSDQDPLLAAYAFKFLIRVCKPLRDDLPQGVLQRSEFINVLWADLVDQKPLGTYFEGWFQEQEWLKQQMETNPRLVADLGLDRRV